jgi:hypothetical protein
MFASFSIPCDKKNYFIYYRYTLNSPYIGILHCTGLLLGIMFLYAVKYLICLKMFEIKVELQGLCIYSREFNHVYTGRKRLNNIYTSARRMDGQGM